MSGSKVGKSKGDSPLERLMDLSKSGKDKGDERGLTAFPEVLADGWTVVAQDPTKKGFEKVYTNHGERVMVVPDDDGAFAFTARVHEQAHVAMTPLEDSMNKWSAGSGIPPAVLMAFEDGRVNGTLMREVPEYKERLKELPWPIDLPFTRAQIEEARKYAEQSDFEEGTNEYVSDHENEVRVTTAALMAALMQHRHFNPAEWRELADIGYLSDEQAEMVFDFCEALPEMSFEDMVAHMQELFELFYEEPPEMEREAAEGEAAVAGAGIIDPDAEPDDSEDVVPGVGGGGPSKGKDYEKTEVPPDVFVDVSKASQEVVEVKPIERPKPIFSEPRKIAPKLPAAVSRTLTQSSYKVAGLRPELWGGKKRVGWSPTYSPPGFSPSGWTPTVKPTKKAAAAVLAKHDLMAEEDITKPNYGVSVQEENWMAEAMGGRGGGKFERGRMEVIDNFKLDVKIINPSGTSDKATKQDRVGYMTNPVRARIDGRVFRRKRKSFRQKPAGAVLLDFSGSMSPSSAQLVKALEIAPYAIVGAYAGDDRGTGSFAIVAENGMAVSEETLRYLISSMGGGNSVDFQALEWLAEQPGPRIWCSDGFICGTASDTAEHVHRAFQLCREKEIKRVHQLAQLVGMEPLRNNLRAELGL